MEKHERMKNIIERNYSGEIDGQWYAELASGTITIEKQEKFKIVFRETGFKKRGKIFSESEIAPYFDDLFLQMLPARFDMILRVAGSVFVRKLNELNIDREKIVINVRLGVGIDGSPVSCPEIKLTSWGPEDAEPLENEIFYEVAEIIDENLDLLIDSFLAELRDIVNVAPVIHTKAALLN